MTAVGYVAQGGDYHTREYLRSFGRALDRAGLSRRGETTSGSRFGHYLRRAGLERNYIRWRGQALIVGLGWPRDPGPFPLQYWSEVVPFISDCWPAHYDRWAERLRRLRVRVVFVFASDAAEALQTRLPGVTVRRVSEGITPSEWQAGPPLVERGLDVLELGRHYPRYHEAITDHLREGVSHRYSTEASRTPIFPGNDGLRQGLADSKIQVCFPKSLTHPDTGPIGGPGAGNLEVLTQRYMEAIAAGSLIVGHAPRDLVELFGYDPAIEADMEHPVEQLHELLDHIEDYQDLVTRNQRRLGETCTWDLRVAQMLGVLGGLGYDVPVPSVAAATNEG